MASAISNASPVPLLAGTLLDFVFPGETLASSGVILVRGPGAIQLVTSPADKAEIEKVAVFEVENCRLTCFSRSGHQFVFTNKDRSVSNR